MRKKILTEECKREGCTYQARKGLEFCSDACEALHQIVPPLRQRIRELERENQRLKDLYNGGPPTCNLFPSNSSMEGV